MNLEIDYIKSVQFENQATNTTATKNRKNLSTLSANWSSIIT